MSSRSGIRKPRRSKESHGKLDKLGQPGFMYLLLAASTILCVVAQQAFIWQGVGYPRLLQGGADPTLFHILVPTELYGLPYPPCQSDLKCSGNADHRYLRSLR